MSRLIHEHLVEHPDARHMVTITDDRCVLTMSCIGGDGRRWPLTTAQENIVLSGTFASVRRDVRAMLTVLDAARRATRRQARA